MGNDSYCAALQAGGKPYDAKPSGAKAYAENLTIPKHRFDCVNLCLKETKAELRIKTAEAETAEARIAELEGKLLELAAEKLLAVHGAKNLTAAKALLDFTDLKPERDGIVPGLEEQVLRMKKSQSYLFESLEQSVYALIPIKSGADIAESITEYMKTRKEI